MTTIPSATAISGEAFQTSSEEPTQRNKTQAWETYFCRLGRNVSTIVIPTITMVALANLPVANADKFTDCMDNCNRTTDGGLPRTICYGLCGLLSLFG